MQLKSVIAASVAAVILGFGGASALPVPAQTVLAATPLASAPALPASPAPAESGSSAPVATAAPIAQRLAFVEHAAFFSLEAKTPALIDPQAFVAVAGAPEVPKGLQGIPHIAGVRNALMVDDPERPVLSGTGKPLGFTLGRWFAAAGTVDLAPQANGTERIAMHFTQLVSGGRYSLFENHFNTMPVTFTPLDGAGTANSFVASKDGSANVMVLAPAALTHDNAVLAVYHSDGIDHGQSRGVIGIDAHHHIIARIP